MLGAQVETYPSALIYYSICILKNREKMSIGNGILLLLPLLFVLLAEAQEQQPKLGEVQQEGEQQQQANSNSEEQKVPKCGTKESDFAPCLTRDRADDMFKQCCSQYVPEGCHSLCQYEADELTARNLLLQAVKSKKCDLKHFGTILYCASQNQDNRKCCQHLNLADPKLSVGERCLRFCDPGGEGGIDSISRADVTCLFNWNVLMYCHHSGIKLA